MSVKFVLKKKKNHKHPKMMKANGFFFPFENNQICEKKKKYRMLINYQAHITIKEASDLDFF